MYFSLYFNTVELVQAVKILASGQCLFPEACTTFLWVRQEHHKFVKEKVLQILSFAADTEDDLQASYIRGWEVRE